MNDLIFFKKACFTGYRPEKFPFKLNRNSAEYEKMIDRIYKTLEALIEDDCKIFYTGMAMGFDIICAECVLELRKKYKDIQLICAIPHEKQNIAYPVDWQQRYKYVLNKCDRRVLVNYEYHKNCFQERNMYMVDNSDFVVCWYDGKPGGTRNTLRYAQKQDRTVINININYLENFDTLQTMICL